MSTAQLFNANNLEILKSLPDNSVDSVVTDPPYGISFMNKKWDYDVPTVDTWKEVLRVLKPGGHILVACGTRTQHRMAVNIEDAGFEIRDIVSWVYGSGFPKSLSIGKAVNSLETKEWSKISNAIDNTDQKSIMGVWKNNAKLAEIQLSKSLTEAGSNTPRKFFVPDIAVLYSNQENKLFSAIIAEMRLKGLSLILEEDGIIAVENAGQTIELLPENARLAVKLSESPNLKCWNIFTAQFDVKEWLKENTEVSLKVDEALKTLRGNKKYSSEEITNVLCAVIPSVLKHTILNQSKTFQKLDTTQQMECASAINVIITEYTAENLILNTVDILKSKAVDKLQGNERKVVEIRNWNDPMRKPYTNKHYGGERVRNEMPMRETKGNSPYEGWGTALKPAMELWTLARKPLSEKNIAQNVLKWGTGGINIDGSRVEGKYTWRASDSKIEGVIFKNGSFGKQSILGRFPANIIHDGSDEVTDLFPNDSQRFFYSCNYTLKYDTMSVCKHLSANIVAKVLMTIQATPEITATLSAVDLQEEKLDQNVRSAITGCEKCVTPIVQELVRIKNLASSPEGLQAIRECIGSYKSSILTQNLVEIVEKWVNTDTTPTTTNLLTLFGSVLLAIDENTSSDTKERAEQKSEHARFLYQAKASKSERNRGLDGFKEKAISDLKGNGLGRVCNLCGASQLKPCKCDGNNWILPAKFKNHHPTVKPIALMKYLTKLITPVNGVVLDPYMGSGSTGIACKEEGFRFIGIELDPEYFEIAKARINNA